MRRLPLVAISLFKPNISYLIKEFIFESLQNHALPVSNIPRIIDLRFLLKRFIFSCLFKLGKAASIFFLLKIFLLRSGFFRKENKIFAKTF